jgi:adenine/guanine phosphoribosyltransferase-like PRPP-binding protein
MERKTAPKFRILSNNGEPFLDRVEAGKLLAVALREYRGQNAVVVGIPRGGIIVAREIALALDADLDIIVAHKLRTPGQGELAMGSISERGDLFLNREVLKDAGVTNSEIEQEKVIQKAEIQRRTSMFRTIKPKIPLNGRIVIVTDDGVATGATTLSILATWLNENGFRTRNMHRLPDANGHVNSGPRLFTTASVRGILHNPFYMGKVTHTGKILPGIHEAVIGQDIFETVQTTLRKNSGRSETLTIKPNRQYLLKGIVRCAYCGLPMSSQTYNSGSSYYREHKTSRSSGACMEGGSVTCPNIDEQVDKLVCAIELGPQWLEEVLSIISLKDEVARVKKDRLAVIEKQRRLGKAFVDGLFPDEEYHRQKKLLEMELESLVVPAANAAEEAGNLIMNLKNLWAEANLEERRKLLLTMLDAVYVDTKKTKSIVAIRPKPPFKPVFQVAAAKEGSEIRIINEPIKGTSVFLVETGEG